MADIEAAKRAAAERAVAEHFDPSARYVGIGSGTTIVHVVEAIRALKADTSGMGFVPTGAQSRQLIEDAGLRAVAFDSLAADVLLDVAFDGADEIDEELNCIKGGGACLYQEKLVATRARKFVCVADHRKLQPRLLTKWRTVPVEVEPLAAGVVEAALRALGSTGPVLRAGKSSSPARTDQGLFIIDAPFSPLLLPRDVDGARLSQPDVDGKGQGGRWEVQKLAGEIKMIEGVLSVGIFSGENGREVLARGGKTGGQKPIAAYFGMEDGSVTVRRASDVKEAK